MHILDGFHFLSNLNSFIISKTIHNQRTFDKNKSYSYLNVFLFYSCGKLSKKKEMVNYLIVYFFLNNIEIEVYYCKFFHLKKWGKKLQ